MKKFLNILFKYLCLFVIGGLTYILIEITYRGYSHWTMFLLGGICFLALGKINDVLSWKTCLIMQSFIGASLITILEYITGVIVNIWLGWNVWDYSDMLLNLNGQICLPFFLLWIPISIIGIIVDDYLRYWLFDERKPQYIII